MATQKFYLSNVNATSPLAPHSKWDDTTLNGVSALTLTPQGTNVAASRAEANNVNEWDVLLRRFVSPPITQAGTLESVGTLVDIMWAVQESSTSANMFTSYVVYVATSTGALRGELSTAAGGTEWTATLTGKLENTPASFATPVACQPGDVVIVELGYQARNTSTTNFTGTIRYGGTATTDLASGDIGTNATTRPGWIRFTGANSSDLWATPPAPPARTNRFFHVLAHHAPEPAERRDGGALLRLPERRIERPRIEVARSLPRAA